jgi:hypothetical protein
MKKYWKPVFGFGMLFVLVGCVSTENVDYLYKPGATLRKKDADSFECKLKAVNAVPVNNQTYSTPGYTTPVSCTTNYGYTQCTGGQTIGGGIDTVDVNSELRNQVENRCMAEKGYRKTSIALPMCKKESVPAGFVNANTKISTPVDGACWVKATENASIILLPEEQL